MTTKEKRFLFMALISALIIVALTREQMATDNQQDHVNTPEAKDKKVYTQQDAKMWTLACSAVLIERNHGRHDCLSPNEINEKNIEKNKQLLSNWWGIKSREDLLDNLTWLETAGHSKKFEELNALIQILSKQEYTELLRKYQDDPETLQRIRIVKDYYEELGPKSLLGWDYARYICLCRWGYLSEYITEEESWKMIIPAAKRLQQTFDSWEDLGRNYVIGRQFWSYEQTQKDGFLYEDAFQRLIDMKSSPWNKYPWDMDLTEIESISEPNEAEPKGAVPSVHTI